jgi:hypothetical protein
VTGDAAAGSLHLLPVGASSRRQLQPRRNAADGVEQARPPERHGRLEVRRRRVRGAGPQLQEAAVDAPLVRRQERPEEVVVDTPRALKPRRNGFRLARSKERLQMQ